MAPIRGQVIYDGLNNIVKDHWDQKFISGFDFPALMELLEATRFMDIPDLEDLILTQVASLLSQWKSPRTICLKMGCPPDVLKNSSLAKKIKQAGFTFIPEHAQNVKTLITCAFFHLKPPGISTESAISLLSDDEDEDKEAEPNRFNKARILATKIKGIHRILELTDLYADVPNPTKAQIRRWTEQLKDMYLNRGTHIDFNFEAKVDETSQYFRIFAGRRQESVLRAQIRKDTGRVYAPYVSNKQAYNFDLSNGLDRKYLFTDTGQIDFLKGDYLKSQGIGSLF